MWLSSLAQQSRGLADLVTVGRITSFGLFGEESNQPQVSGQFGGVAGLLPKGSPVGLMRGTVETPCSIPTATFQLQRGWLVLGDPPHSTYKPGSAGETGTPLGSPLPHLSQNGQ